MDTLTQVQQNRRIIHDLASSTLVPIPTAFGRLAYLASLRDLATNVYEHAGLAALYPPEAVRQALEQCHEELFERVLEMPLTLQEEDLRRHLSSSAGGLPGCGLRKSKSGFLARAADGGSPGTSKRQRMQHPRPASCAFVER